MTRGSAARSRATTSQITSTLLLGLLIPPLALLALSFPAANGVPLRVGAEHRPAHLVQQGSLFGVPEVYRGLRRLLQDEEGAGARAASSEEGGAGEPKGAEGAAAGGGAGAGEVSSEAGAAREGSSEDAAAAAAAAASAVSSDLEGGGPVTETSPGSGDATSKSESADAGPQPQATDVVGEGTEPGAALATDGAASASGAVEGGAVVGAGAVPVQELGEAEQLALEKRVHEDEEQAASFMADIMGIHNRLTPTLAGMREKTAKHVLPKLVSLAMSTHAAFTHTSKTLSSRLHPFMGGTVSPLLATLISFSLLLLPLLLVAFLVNKVRVVLTVRKAVLLANLYLTLYCAGLLFACIVAGAEPMSSLRLAAEPNFYTLQIVQACGYALYLLLLVVHVIAVAGGSQALASGDKSKALSKDKEPPSKVGLLKAGFQLVAAASVGLHYYVTVFEPAMLDRSPNTGAWAYLAYCGIFGLLTSLSRGEGVTDGKQR